MELTFEQIDGYWIAEFEVSADFNLHIERPDGGTLYIYQRTAGSEYDYVNEQGYLSGDKVIDTDIQGLVYPKFIKIKSKVKPPICTITTNGEINELKYQEKTLEITSNGTTKVTADTGYNGLAQVNVKVNVPTEGGGEEGGGDKVVYLDITQAVFPMEDYLDAMLTMMPILAAKESSMNKIMSSAMAINDKSAEHFSAIAILSNFRCPVDSDRDVNTNALIEQFKQFGATEITKEEFYYMPKVEE